MKLLIKKNAQSLCLLIIYDLKLYYLYIQLIQQTLVLKQVYLLEEIPNLKEFKDRINYYQNQGGYKPLNEVKTEKYLNLVKNLMSTYVNYLDKMYLIDLPDIYNGQNFNSDFMDLYQTLSTK